AESASSCTRLPAWRATSCRSSLTAPAASRTSFFTRRTPSFRSADAPWLLLFSAYGSGFADAVNMVFSSSSQVKLNLPGSALVGRVVDLDLHAAVLLQAVDQLGLRQVARAVGGRDAGAEPTGIGNLRVDDAAGYQILANVLGTLLRQLFVI